MSLKELMVEARDRIRESRRLTMTEIAEELGISRSLLVNSLNPRNRITPALRHILALGELAQFDETEMEDLKVAIVEWKLERRAAEVHRLLLESIPKTRLRDVLLSIVPHLDSMK